MLSMLFMKITQFTIYMFTSLMAHMDQMGHHRQYCPPHLLIINTSILLVLALVLDILSGGRLLIILDLECLLVSLHHRVFLK